MISILHYCAQVSGINTPKKAAALINMSLSAAIAISLAGCASRNSSDTLFAESDYAVMPDYQVMEYQIGASDVISVSVWNHPDLNRKVIVRPDGRISFPLIGDIYAIGLIPAELRVAMEAELSKYFDIIPGEVSIVVDEVHSYKVSVLGEVRLPGRFEFLSQVSVLDALAEAGGLTEFASRSDILILRLYEGETEKIRFDYDRVAISTSNERRVLIYPGDIIFVP